jgi:hypothetical protein
MTDYVDTGLRDGDIVQLKNNDKCQGIIYAVVDDGYLLQLIDHDNWRDERTAYFNAEGTIFDREYHHIPLDRNAQYRFVRFNEIKLVSTCFFGSRAPRTIKLGASYYYENKFVQVVATHGTLNLIKYHYPADAPPDCIEVENKTTIRFPGTQRKMNLAPGKYAWVLQLSKAKEERRIPILDSSSPKKKEQAVSTQNQSLDLVSRFKKNSKVVGYKVARLKLTQGARNALISIFLKNKKDKERRAFLNELLLSEEGEALIQLLLGTMPHLPMVGNMIAQNEHMMGIADDLQTEGTAMLAHKFTDVFVSKMIPLVSQTMNMLDEQEKNIRVANSTKPLETAEELSEESSSSKIKEAHV